LPVADGDVAATLLVDCGLITNLVDGTRDVRDIGDSQPCGSWVRLLAVSGVGGVGPSGLRSLMVAPESMISSDRSSPVVALTTRAARPERVLTASVAYL
jgi:hypothetical protein